MQVRSLGWEDPLEKRQGNPLQYLCLENSEDRGASVGFSTQSCKELDTTEVTQHTSSLFICYGKSPYCTKKGSYVIQLAANIYNHLEETQLAGDVAMKRRVEKLQNYLVSFSQAMLGKGLVLEFSTVFK